VRFRIGATTREVACSTDSPTLLPLALFLLAIYAFFSIAIDVRAIRRLLERRSTSSDGAHPVAALGRTRRWARFVVA
jgi:hypothetical protein